MKTIFAITALSFATLTLSLLAHGGERSAKLRWLLFCEDLENKSSLLAQEYYSLSPEQQAEARNGMAPPNQWVHFNCQKNWDDFGVVCNREKRGPIENCIYSKVIGRVDWSRRKNL